MEVVKLCLSQFDRQQKTQLLPFVVTTTLYLLQPYPHGTLIGITFKVLPMISLIWYVMSTKSDFPTKTRRISMETVLPQDPYSYYIFAGLVISTIADILIAMPYLGCVGVTIFSFAHVSYTIGIDASGRHRGWNSNVASLYILLAIATFLAIETCLELMFYKLFFLVYFFPLFLAAWKAGSAFVENPNSKACMLACIGSLSFVVSDFLILVKVSSCLHIPLCVHIYMLTYYGAQFGWATSTHWLNAIQKDA